MNGNTSTLLEQSFSPCQAVHFPCCIPAKGGKAPTFPVKLVVCPEAESSDLCQVGGDLFQENGGELATGRFLNATASIQR